MADPTPDARSRIQPVLPVPFPERARRPGYLPVPLTTFVGRDREVAAVAALVARPGVRLVTLTGPGGVGKTRLAIRAAEAAADAFPDGVWFVELAPIRDRPERVPALVAATIADALGLEWPELFRRAYLSSSEPAEASATEADFEQKVLDVLRRHGLLKNGQ